MQNKNSGLNGIQNHNLCTVPTAHINSTCARFMNLIATDIFIERYTSTC